MKSYFHNGTVHGDALEAPYGAELFSSLIAATYAPARNCVIWNTAQNSLRVDGTAGKSVDVNTGTGFIQGIVYTNSAVVNVTVPDNTTAYPRIDAVIVRFVAEDNEARIALKNGIPASVPTPPSIKDNELLLAEIYLAPAFATVPSTVVYDKRQFAYNSDHAKYFYTDNTMINSEFIAFAGAADTSYGSAPDYWTETGTVLFYPEDKFDEQARGRTIRIVADAAGEGMSTVLVSTEGTTKMFTVAVLFKVISGILQITWAGTSKLYYPSANVQTAYIRVSTNGYQTLSFLSSGAAAEFQIGQITLTQGYIPAPFEAKHETLFFTEYYTPTAAYLNQSTGVVAISYSSSVVFLREYIKAVLVQLRVNDAGSAGAGTIRADVGNIADDRSTVWVGGITNDAAREGFGVTRFEGSPTANYIYLYLSASGAGAMDVRLYILGIIV